MKYTFKKLTATVLLTIAALSGTQAQNSNNYIRLYNDGTHQAYAGPISPVTVYTKIQTHIRLNKYFYTNFHDIFGSWDGEDMSQVFFMNIESGYFHAFYGTSNAKLNQVNVNKDYWFNFERGSVYIDEHPNLSVHDYSADLAASDISGVKKIYIGSVATKEGTPHLGYGILDANFYDFTVFEDKAIAHHYIPAKFNDKYQFYDTRHDEFIPTEGAEGHIENGDNCEHRYVAVENGQIHCKICDDKMTYAQWVNSNTEDFGVTTVDPYLDTQADAANTGRQILYLNGQSPIDHVYVVDSATNKELVKMELPKAEKSLSVPLPTTDKKRTLYVLAHIEHARMNGTQNDTSIVYAPLTIEQKPYHVIDSIKIEDKVEIQTKGNLLTAKHYPRIRVAMEDPEAEDIMQGDMFVLQRAYEADFSDATNVTTFDLSDFTESETLPDGKVLKWAVAIDEDDEAQYTTNPNDKETYSQMPEGLEKSSNLTEMERALLSSFYEYPDRRIYYRVFRSTVGAIWQSHLEEDHESPYVNKGFAKPAVLLPKVSSVSVQQTENWQEDKMVNVIVRLDNPMPWQLNNLLDSTKIVREAGGLDKVYRRYSWPEDSKAKIILQRYSPAISHDSKGTDYALKTYTIETDKVEWDEQECCYKATISDCQSLPYIYYYYKAMVDITDVKYPADADNSYMASSDDDAKKCFSENAALIQSFTASQGDIKGKVHVEWEMGSGLASVQTLKREDIVDKTVKDINIDNNATSYIDTDSIKPGHVYRYTLTSTTRFLDQTYTKTCTTLGWPSFYGTLKGRVQMHNGLGIAGAHVRISRKDPIDIPDVYEEDNLLLKGVHEGLIAEAPAFPAPEINDIPLFDSVFVREIITDEKGYFELDSALYTSEGAKYDITVNHGYCEFKYNDRVTSSAQLVLSGRRCEYEDVNFTSNNDKTVKGRVLYEKSTVPVRDAWFELNGKPIYDSNGKKVLTDQSGNFTLTMPNAIVESLKVIKEGHNIMGGGYILSKDEEISYKAEDRNGLTIWDQTKVRLVGRLAGGNRQGEQPLGFALSRNNLGDDLTMVLQLEGDNTAQIVYMDEHPDSTEINTQVVHPYSSLNQQIQEQQDYTDVSYQRKRIVVKPSEETGEFFIDLFPTKYKVTQLSARGYDNLYSADEGFDILDLTNAVDPLEAEYTTGDNDILNYGYNATYKRIYHQPITVTTTQFTRGKAVKYLGEGSIREKNIMNDPVNMSLYDNDNDRYTFGYPLFVSGTRYTMQVQAHEDYYYNGNGVLDKVLVEGGELIVRNGLADNMRDASYQLDNMGTATIFVDADNPTFSLSGEKALRKLNLSVKTNGYYYEAAPIMGYVTGARYKGTDVVAESGLTIVDVLRDPIGASSYSFLESGSQYSWENSHKIDINLCPVIKTGVGTYASATIGGWAGMGGGAFAGTGTSQGGSMDITIGIPIYSYQNYEMGTYTLTVNDRIQTSSNPKEAGAMSDVYIGTVNTMNIGRMETISMIDAVTHDFCAAAIENGQIRVLAQGKDKDGKDYWLVIADKVTASTGMPRTFAYSQKYILGTLIPEMYNIISERLIVDKTKEEVQEIANKQNKIYYLSTVDITDDNFALPGYYETILPKGFEESQGEEDLIAKASNMIINWAQAIYDNEQEKVEAMQSKSSDAIKSYSIAGAKINHSEASSYYYQHLERSTSGFATGNGWSLGIGSTGTGGSPGFLRDESFINTPERRGYSAYVDVPGFHVSFDIDPGFNLSTSGFPLEKHYRNVTTGYEMSTNDGGYMDVDVYRDKLITGNDDKGGLGWITEDSKNAEQVGNYIFVARGGAARNPWMAPDSTLFYMPGTPLGAQLMKIENPKVYIDKPVVNNLPGDETATFTIRMSNETELTQQGLSGIKSSTLSLYVDDASNPLGAKVSIDGEPLTGGRTFVIAPGKSIEKVMEVKRGAKGYDYENLKLMFSDQTYTLIDSANFSVHYVPTSTPVKLAAPTDKWVLNTLSEPDDQGYFLPVTISNFNVRYENFDHIELQYKKQTDGNSQWVTLCSWYCDEALYDNATGVKELFDESTQNLKYAFHGEKDPMEMKYDLRAVSFCRLGTGYVTRASEVVSGTKDTRCPEIFGMPTPASGILTYEDVIQLNFTEPIAYNYLDETSNFKVQGYTNKSDISQSSTLLFPGTEEQRAETEVLRNLNNRSFTIDMLAQALTLDHDMVLFSHGNQMENMAFGVTEDGCLFARLSGVNFKSAPLTKYEMDITKALTHVGMLYNSNTQKVQFFAGSGIISNDNPNDHTTANYNGNGIISMGRDANQNQALPFHGKMLDVRLWGTELSDNQISTLGGKHLNGYEKQLIGYWPMTETRGDIIADNAHGAFMNISGGVEWNNVEGFSLKTIKNRVELDAEYFSTTNDNDNTLTFWFKVDDMTQPDAALLTVGDEMLPAKNNGRMSIAFKHDKLVLTSNGEDYVLGSKEKLANKDWHHFAMSVDRSQDQFAAYIDAQLVVQEPASAIDGMSSDYAALGDTCLSAHFDVLSQWDLALPSPVITHTYNTRYSGHEMGLHAYLPFTVYDTNSQGDMRADSCLMNAVYQLNDKGQYVMSSRRLITDGFDASVNLDKHEHAPICELAALENLDFSWSSTGTGLQININTNDRMINKEQIFVTVRGVEDLAGNVMKNPRMMMYYVDKNVLRWNKRELNIECNEGQADTIEVKWKNVSGHSISYTIDNIPSWITMSEHMGTVEPAQEKTFIMTVDAGLAAGKYTTSLYLTDEMGLTDPMILNLVVKPAMPGWTVDKTKFDRNMNLRGVVHAKNCNGTYTIDNNSGDIVAAFINSECVGVSHITTDDYSAYLMMTIYGNKEIVDNAGHNNISFLLWNHETGITSYLEHVDKDGNVVPIYFKTNSVVGLPGDNIYSNEPVILRTSDTKEQNIHMESGWNWISMNVTPRATNDLNGIFVNQNDIFSDGDIIKRIDYAQYDSKSGKWQGSLKSMNASQVYQCYVSRSGNYKIIGTALPNDSAYVIIHGGKNGQAVWNDLPYLLEKAMTVEDAMVDFQIGEKAHHGDVIKSMDEFIVADSVNHKWVGTLKYMRPGKGYYIYHHGDADACVDTIRYYPTMVNYGSNDFSDNVNRGSASQAKSQMMPVIARMSDSMTLSEGETLVAIINGEVVARGTAVETKDGELMFISVRGNEGDRVTFAIESNGEVIASDQRTVTVSAQGTLGTLDVPYIIGANGEKISGDNNIYDLSGRRMSGTLNEQHRGIYITNNKKIQTK